MGAKAELDFASLLDDLLAASVEADDSAEDASASPSLHVDLLEQLERLQAENGAVFREGAMRAYGEAASGEPARSGEGAARTKPAVHLEPALEDLFFLDPETISKELGIRPKSSQEELDKARRTFAMRYHPDRVPEELRERAALRMQIANVLIDEAKRKRR